MLDGLSAALESEADCVCIDLEDAVPPEAKSAARQDVLAALAGVEPAARSRLVVRINSLRCMAGLHDVAALTAASDLVSALVLPKVDTADEIRWAGSLLDDAKSGLGLLAIIETVDGLQHVRAIARAHSRLEALLFGGFDLSTALGAEMAWEPLLYARSRVVHAGAGADLPVLDSPYPLLDDAGLAIACEQARALGMSGKAAKHASQIGGIHSAFTPSAEALALAHRVVAAFDLEPTRPLVVDGKLVELPTVKRMRRLIAANAASDG